MTYGGFLSAALLVGGLAAIASPTSTRAADKARLTDLADISFGLITSVGDQSMSQSVCAFSASNTGGYSVTAIGSGASGSFELSGGPAPLPYDVLWASAANQTSGTALVANATTPGFVSTASQQTCNSGPSSSGSLTVVIRSSTLSSARAGSYAGTLELTIAPE